VSWARYDLVLRMKDHRPSRTRVGSGRLDEKDAKALAAAFESMLHPGDNPAEWKLEVRKQDAKYAGNGTVVARYEG